MIVSRYKNFNNKLEDKDIIDVFNEIKAEKYQSDIKSIRYALHKGDHKKADEIKSSLIAFTASGTFGVRRTKSDLVSYSKIVGLDFDDIPIIELDEVIIKINSCKHTFASFISPSGYGVKVFVRVIANALQHHITYNQVAEYYQTLTNFDFDPKCKDITRLCFVSSDAELYLNEDAEIYEVKQVEVKSNKSTEKVEQSAITEELLDKCLRFTEKKEQYYKGNRNNFIYLFACNANSFGIYQEDTKRFCVDNFDLDESETKATINSAYKGQSTDFASFAKFANLQSITSTSVTENKNEFEEYEDCLKSTPTIPQLVYDNLPPILLESCRAFIQPRERDTFLTGALATLSCCLPNVSGTYGGSFVYPNLFSFILAPAASGKGTLRFAKALADKYHDKTLAASIDDKKIYAENLAAFKMKKGKGKIDENQEMPIEPKFKVVFIPADTSNAKIIQHLDTNDGKGIICETEADTMGQAFKNEWGSYSDLLRKSFHHEKISVSRKTDGEFVEVNNPQLSVALSGTPKQVFNIISSAEDGLFSRFIFYVFKTDAVWLDPSPKGNPVNLTEYFEKQSRNVLKMVEFYETDEMVLDLTLDQWNRFNLYFESILEEVNTFVSEDALSVVKRLGLVFYRFCMIFTAIRKYDSNNYNKNIFCSDIDFDVAMSLIKTYLQHSVIMFTNLPKQGEQGVFKSSENKKRFLEALPVSFKRKEAIEMAKKFNLKERSVDSFLKSCVGIYLEQIEYGTYTKILSK